MATAGGRESVSLESRDLQELVVALWLATLASEGQSREVVATKIGYASGSTVGTELSRDAQRLGRHLEMNGLVPNGAITGYRRRVDSDSRPRFFEGAMGSRWSELLEIEHERSGPPPRHRHPVDALTDGEALLDELVVAPDPPARRALVESSLASATVAELILLSSRPFSVQREAGHLLAAIASYHLDPLLEAVQSEAVGELLGRPLERAARRNHLSQDDRYRISSAAANPPDRRFIRRVPWLRLLRRCALLQIERGKPVESWQAEQLLIALSEERAYAWITPAERRFAYWIADELADHASESDARTTKAFRAISELASSDPILFPLMDLAPTTTPTSRYRDRVRFRPIQGWPLPDAVEQALTESWFAEVNSQTPQWPGAFRTGNRHGAVRRLLIEGITTPCAIRYSTALAAIEAAGPAVRDHAAVDLASLLDALVDLHDVPEAEPFVERCVGSIGYMRSAAGADSLIRLAYDERVSRTLRHSCTWAIGDVLGGLTDTFRHLVDDNSASGGEKRRVQAELEAAVGRTPELSPDRSVWAAAIRGVTVARATLGSIKPHREAVRDSQIRELESWHTQVLAHGHHGTATGPIQGELFPGTT